jgi:hypothetical protein
MKKDICSMYRILNYKRPQRPRGRLEVQLYSIFNLTWVGGQCYAPAALTLANSCGALCAAG